MNVLEIEGVVHYELYIKAIYRNDGDNEAPKDTAFAAMFETDIFSEGLRKIIGISTSPEKVYFSEFFFEFIVDAIRSKKTIFVAFDTRCRKTKIASVIPSIPVISEPPKEVLINE